MRPALPACSWSGGTSGLKGLGSFLRRLTLWRAPFGWWLFLILGIPAIVYTGAALNGTIGDPFPSPPGLNCFRRWRWPCSSAPSKSLAGADWPCHCCSADLPRLGRLDPWRHLGDLAHPLFPDERHAPERLVIRALLPGHRRRFRHPDAVLFNVARGSLLIAVLYHFQMMNPIWPDAQPWDNFFFVAVAVIVVWLNRRQMFKRGSGVTDVIMPEGWSVF